ncbi:MAG: LysR family transcriptional regulator [Bdellovibrionales bacterium]
MNPNFSDLKYFIDVSKTGNISRSAERLGISQPSLSLALKRLEQATGVALLSKGRSGSQLTKAGQKFLVRSKNLTEEWSLLTSDLQNNSTDIQGKYSIGCHASVAQYCLSHFLPQLTIKYPKLEMELQHGLSRKITEKVISGTIDFGIVVNPVRHLDLVIQKLYKDEVKFWTAKKPSKNQNRDHGQLTLVCDPELVQSQKLLQELKKKNLIFDRVITSSSLEVISQLCSEGTGIGIIPQTIAKQSKKLKVFDENLPVYKDQISLIHRADRNLNPSSRIIIESMKKALK